MVYKMRHTRATMDSSFVVSNRFNNVHEVADVHHQHRRVSSLGRRVMTGRLTSVVKVRRSHGVHCHQRIALSAGVENSNLSTAQSPTVRQRRLNNNYYYNNKNTKKKKEEKKEEEKKEEEKTRTRTRTSRKTRRKF